MKTWMKISIAATLAGVFALVACGDDKAKVKETNDRISLIDRGFGKPAPAAQTLRLDKMSDGLYRLREVRMEVEFLIPGTEPEKRRFDKLTMAATQAFQGPRARSGAEKFDVAALPLRKAIVADAPDRADVNVTLPVSMKIPLTVRVNQGSVSFEQIRLLWVCLKNKGECERERYLSAGRSENDSVIHPASYLVTRGLGATDADLTTQISSMRTGGTTRGLWIEFESPMDESGASPLRIRARFDVDPTVHAADRSGNADEESLRAAEPTPG